ncbi:type II restriction endonuclease [Pedobacter panaciterrae]
MKDVLELAIASVQKAESSFCKFISANDAGATGGHQSGFYIPKTSVSLIFDEPGEKGTNKDRFATIRWQDDFETASRFIYYGTLSRNEYRITRFGRKFPYLNDENVGNLFILSKINPEYYEAFILDNDDDFENFFAAFNIDAAETNRLIPKTAEVSVEDRLMGCFTAFINTLNNQFPSTALMAQHARDCFNSSYGITPKIIKSLPDKSLLSWVGAEYELFKIIENKIYAGQLQTSFENVEALVVFANTILNRRKSRAGKSLEFHLAEIFELTELNFNAQAVTESKKRPDFIFPSAEAYHDNSFDENKLIFLASKTTCKDRWRQIINEADRIKTKHLFTLQQGISSNQLEEMADHHVKLVVPVSYIKTFPEKHQRDIISLENFVQHVKHSQG